MNIKQVEFPQSQYMREEFSKLQIYLHHTAGSGSGENVFKFWSTNKERIATCVCISNNGDIVQGFSSKYWAFHLGLKESTFNRFNIPYTSLDKISIGVEICNWGQLTERGGKYYNYVNIEVPKKSVIKLDKPFKGFEYFENYTDAQIKSVSELLDLWHDRYNINIKYNADIWDICPRALRGESGVYTHNSVRTDKVDVYPHPGLIEMLSKK